MPDLYRLLDMNSQHQQQGRSARPIQDNDGADHSFTKRLSSSGSMFLPSVGARCIGRRSPMGKFAATTGENGGTAMLNGLTPPLTVFEPLDTRASARRKSIDEATSDFTVNKLRFDTLEMYGRQEEISQLKTVVNEMATTAQVTNDPTNPKTQQQPALTPKQLVLISGSSGTGKSCLAMSVGGLVRQRLGGTLAVGKFEQSLGGNQQQQAPQQQRPFTAYNGVCEQLAQEIKAKKQKVSKKSKNDFQLFKDEIMTQLGTELIDLIQIFPSLDVIISAHDNETSTNAARTNQQQFDQPESNGSRLGSNIGTANAEARNRFKYIFRVLMRITSSFLSPMVMVLDDLQWADASSLDLLESLLFDCENTNMMIIGIYRSNEVNETHLLSKMIRHLHSTADENKLTITEMELGNLDLSAVHEMLQALLSSDDEQRVLPLAEICHKKTDGNPFYLIHFISMLYDRHLVEYDFGLMDWKWDIEGIQQATGATENVVGMLKKSMCSLSKDNQRLLQYASYLGSVFEERHLFVLWRDCQTKTRNQKDILNVKDEQTQPTRNVFDDEDIRQALTKVIECCKEAGFLEDAGEALYRWVHDKLQEAAMSLIPLEEQQLFSQQVANILGSQLTDEELEAIIFVVANRYNDGLDPIHPETRLKVARLNLRAAKKAVIFSAFENASSYCRHGIDLLPSDRWENHYELCLELYSLGAETAGFLGNADQMEEYCQEVLKQRPQPSEKGSRTSSLAGRQRLREKYRVYNVMVNNFYSQNRFQEAADLCFAVLKQYGTRFPNQSAGPAILCRTLFNIVKIKSSLKNRTAAEVETLPIMSDPARVEQMGMLDKLATYLYFKVSDLLPLVVFRSLHFTLRYGLSKHSPAAFAATAALLAGVLDDGAGGAVYAKYALMLLDKLDPILSKEVESRTLFVVHAFALHWTSPLASMLKPLLRGYEVGMKSGDTESAMYCIFFYIHHSFIIGRNLPTLEGDCRIYAAQMKELKQGPALKNCKLTWQMALNLMGRSATTTELTGDAMQEEEFRREGETVKFLSVLMDAYLQILYSYFREHKKGAKLAVKNGNSFQKATPGAPLTAPNLLHQSLSLLSMARSRKGKRQEHGTSVSRKDEMKYMRLAKKNVSKIKKWVEGGNPNIRHYESLLDAEVAAYHGKINTAKKHFEIAIVMAGRGGFLNDAALANERYGEYLLSLLAKPDDMLDKLAVKEEAIFRLKGSIKYYREWGAIAKVKDIVHHYGDYF